MVVSHAQFVRLKSDTLKWLCIFFLAEVLSEKFSENELVYFRARNFLIALNGTEEWEFSRYSAYVKISVFFPTKKTFRH